MSAIQIIDSTILYRNAAPHLFAHHAYFPSLVCFPDGELLCSLVIGQAFEAADCRVRLARSADGGRTWELLDGEIETGGEGVASYSARLALMCDGTLVMLLFRFDRSAHPQCGLTNPKTLGFVPHRMYLLRSRDRGRTWSEPQTLTPPLPGPGFELCGPVRELADGRWILPTHTWMDWEGNLPSGLQMVLFVSRDQGRTWPEFRTVMRDSGDGVFFWESKVVELQDGVLVAVAWAHDRAKACDLQNHWAFSNDGGETWSEPAPTGLNGQTVELLRLAGERLLCVYRRTDRPGLWAAVVDVENGWRVLDQTELWGGITGMRAAATMTENFAELKFGAPSLCVVPDGGILCAFWCYESNVSNIRLLRLAC